MTPSLITLSYFIGKWFGQKAAGLAAAVPLVVGPILLFINIEQGPDFGRLAVGQALGGALGLGFFTWVYAWLSRTSFLQSMKVGAFVILVLGWISFVLLWGLLSILSLDWIVLAPIALVLNLVFLLTLPPRGETAWPQKKRHLLVELAFRLVFSSVLVLALTGFAQVLGPKASGVFAPFPVAGSVVLVAAFIAGGPESVRDVASGFIQGIFGIFTFLIVWYLTFDLISLATAFGLALVCAIILQVFILLEVKK